jgi:hypothetical protein
VIRLSPQQVAALPGVPEAVERARNACTALRWHPALRRSAAAARAESTARAAWASASLDGAELPLDLVRDILRGAAPAPDDAVGRVVSGALRATVEAGVVGDVVRRAPLQALARLHTAAAAGLVADDLLGRPRPAGADEGLTTRLQGIAKLATSDAELPALVVAALVHGEVLALQPFAASNAVVARALFRSIVVGRGLDPTGVAVPEVGMLQTRAAYLGAASALAADQALSQWVTYCARAGELGAAEGVAVADAVAAGRLPR